MGVHDCPDESVMMGRQFLESLLVVLVGFAAVVHPSGAEVSRRSWYGRERDMSPGTIA